MTTILEHLAAAARKPERTVMGLMSGTSVDSIDVAVCRVGPGEVPVRLLHFEERPFDPPLRSRIKDVPALDVRGVAELHVLIGEAFAAAGLAVLGSAGMAAGSVDLVGSHGQTLYHHSSAPGAMRATLQLGDGDVIAERLGLPVVSDFRARDIAAGGEGAPLSPFADVALFGAAAGAGGGRRAVLNLGGIANVTVLDADPGRVSGFDTGPANSLIDRAARGLTGGELSCDLDGRIARAGRVNEALLGRLVGEDEFVAKAPPKSTGFEVYGDAFLRRAVSLHNGLDADLVRTLTEFTAKTVAVAFERHVGGDPPVTEVVVAGGGARNPVLFERLGALLAPRRVIRSDELGVPSAAREAMAFAVLADLALRGRPSTSRAVTGAMPGAVLGKLSFPRVR